MIEKLFLALPLLYNALLAATYPLSKQGLMYGPLTLFVAIRMLTSGILFLSYYEAMYSFSLFDLHQVKKFFFVSCGTMFIPFLVEAWVLTKLSPVQVNGMYLINPMLCASFEYWFSGKKLGTVKSAALCIGLVASILFLKAQNYQATFTYMPSAQELLILGLFFGAMCIATYSWLSIKKYIRKGYPLSYVNGMIMTIAGFMSLFCFIVLHAYSHQQTIVLTKICLYGSAVALLGNILGFGLLSFMLQRFSLTFIAMMQGTMPFFGALYEYLLYGTIMSGQAFVCLLLTLVSIGVFYSYYGDTC